MAYSTLLLRSILTFCLFSISFVQAYDRRACQAPTRNPLSGCPVGTLLVGLGQKFTSVQSAVLSLGNTTNPATILILPGNYTEQVNVTRQGPLTLLGQTSSPNDASYNVVNIIWHNATGTATTGTYDNAYTSVLTVAPTFNASTTGSGPTGNPVPPGTPFGNLDFRTYNLNFINDYLPYSAGPSLAVSVSYANTGFYYTQFLSYQDTVYIGKLGSAYMYSCIVGGQTDFVYGFGTLWVTESEIQLRGCGGGITAWKGTNTTFENKYGAYIYKSHVAKANSTLNITHECALGRPWNAQHRSIFALSYLDDSIQPNGYIEWSSSDPRVNFNTTMAEFHDFGPGFNLTAREAASNVTIEMTPKEYAPYSTPALVFQYPFSGAFGNVAWIDEYPRA
ncbi:carbohydrate esterase family 8 protein [Baudoinia panamericana UAMH 10762]|uniref:pectinesterase n=1 Tax=Baudoinia panamericana (strain UAMH 10762) TaxID=717646 RepID=M2MMR0_BAUPA|nr:carbohydrate esterase family 8 protein [Baudoinia panamericana UAMH 10762]EMC92708.1 carbohydrate esterase family 8 protein [Baudoinia panamericana UAMH 10762]